MAVVECSCGMVMSVPRGGTRACCIRCGGVEFHSLDHIRDLGCGRGLFNATNFEATPPDLPWRIAALDGGLSEAACFSI
jgi:hypothetical protein